MLLVPGDLATRTGGYAYDRAVVEGLRAGGWTVDVCQLDRSYPDPTPAAQADTRRRLAALPDGTRVLADGLAFGAMAEAAEAEASRLRFIALVHHPLALETGLTEHRRRALRASERRALAAARAVIVTSAATVASLAPYGVPHGRIAVARPGTALAPVARGTRDRVADGPEDADNRGRAGGLDPVPAALLCVATLTPRKGHRRLLDALARLAQRPWRLTCLGSRTLDPETAAVVEAHARERGLADRVDFPGEAQQAALEAAYDAADAFVLPSEHEGYGMAVAEAVARGLPVVATHTGGMPELVDESSGALVPVGGLEPLVQALDRVLDDSTRRQWRRGACARRASLPQWSATVDVVARVLREAAHDGTVQR